MIEQAELIAQKVVSSTARAGTAKGLIDAADILRLLAVFPELRTEHGSVAEALSKSGATQTAFDAWRQFVSQPIIEEEEY